MVIKVSQLTNYSKQLWEDKITVTFYVPTLMRKKNPSDTINSKPTKPQNIQQKFKKKNLKSS